MQAQPTSLSCRPALRLASVAFAAAACCGTAKAEDPTPWYVGGSVGVTHDSNVYRVPNGPGDTYTTTSLLGGFDQPIGRQRLYGTARVGYNKYQENDRLDNTSYGLNAGWDWATIEKLSGNVNVSANQSLAQFNGNTGAPSATRNILKAEQVSTSVNWGGVGPLSLFANYGHSRVHYSAASFTTSNSSADTGGIGTNYRLGGSTTVGIALRLTRTRSPYGYTTSLTPSSLDDFSPSTSNGRNIDLLANWTYSAQTNLAARLSFTHQTDSGGYDRTFSGITGAISGNYAPTAKLVFTGSLSHDAGTNANYYSTTVAGAPGTTTTTTVTGLSQNTSSTTLASLGATYAATAKISVNTGVQYRTGKLSAGGHDDLTQYSLGATYAVARAWQLACSLGHESRKASGGGAFSYDANTVGCSAQFTLR